MNYSIYSCVKLFNMLENIMRDESISLDNKLILYDAYELSKKELQKYTFFEKLLLIEYKEYGKTFQDENGSEHIMDDYIEEFNQREKEILNKIISTEIIIPLDVINSMNNLSMDEREFLLMFGALQNKED